jgi:putative nucleotidyltransferase with HDIG domain
MALARRASGLVVGREAADSPPSAREHLAEARVHERAGRTVEAGAAFERAIQAAEQGDDPRILAESLRRLSVLCHHRNEPERARALCRRSRETAHAMADRVLTAEAINTLGGFELEHGAMGPARELLEEALRLSGDRADLRSRIEQNLGIIATVQGDHTAALGHYRSSLDACQASGDEKGCAIAYHNLAMISADRLEWNEAEAYYEASAAIAERIGDVHLQGLCRLNHAEVHLARQAYGPARESAEAALAIFDRLGSRIDKADAYRVLGMVYRATGRNALAEARLLAAIETAVATGSLLSEAEASRELAKLFQIMGRNQEALAHLNAAWRLFGRLDAHLDLVDIEAKVADLEGTFLAVVRDWGESIESADSYTHGHCERVADFAVAVARELGLTEGEITTIRLGAYLHDVGKVKVPHEILNKPGRLTPEEFEVIQQHPVWGVELLAAIEFPWDIKPIIRWHHEKYDGSGYPDRLAGEQIPLGAQIIGIVDVYDALTTTRSYRPAMAPEEAIARMRETPSFWHPELFESFLRAVAAPVAELV